MEEKIIVSMTSYPARIQNVGKSIYLLLNKQTTRPNEIHLWLAETEFPLKEIDLPDDLQVIINTLDCVHLHWLPKNTYCHKRHEIFKYVDNNACVFFFDDDVAYNKNLITDVMKKHAEYPNTIINYNIYSLHSYTKNKIHYYYNLDFSKPRYDVRWCGQSMIPAAVYPKEVLEDVVQEQRDILSPVCDESWLTPWLVYHDVPILCLHFGWGRNISSAIKSENGLCSSTHIKEPNGLTRRENWLLNVLRKYSFLGDCYRRKFRYEYN